ncbi:MAG: amidohydrolase [Deltaproteobacteria bacterium]|nr:amidohydrolase [Deltaproteobacteria bacterium]
MQIRHGLISADSHIVTDKNAFLDRMSKAKFGDRIPQIKEAENKGQQVDRWFVNGKPLRTRGVVNCPAVMGDPDRNLYPQRWDEVPSKAWIPAERLKALDADGIDAEVLFPNDPSSFHQYNDREFELACIRAYNDSTAEWAKTSDRFIALAMIPLLCGMETSVAEVNHAAQSGHRGIVMFALPSLMVESLPHISDPYWYPLWEACQETELPVHYHASAGLARKLTFPEWDGYTPYQQHAAFTVPTSAWPAQIIPNMIFSGIAYKFPKLKSVFAETGIGAVSSAQAACDHEWERRQLWRHGLDRKPSEVIREQVYVNFWYEEAGMELRHAIGIDNIMWESDYPHIASTYPESWKFVERSLQGVVEDERKQLLYGNAQRLYRR